MRLAVLQHAVFEGPATIGTWALARDIALSISRVYENEMPNLQSFDALVVLGGPMGVYDEEHYPWLWQEKRFLEEAIASGKKILGICLGAQLLAESLGAKVKSMGYKEVGWHPLFWTEEALAMRYFSAFPKTHQVLHWHGDTFALPPESIRLASSNACIEQGFLTTNRLVLGLQFHLEWDLPALEALMQHARDDLLPGPFVDNSEKIRAKAGTFVENQMLLQSLLDQFFCDKL